VDRQEFGARLRQELEAIFREKGVRSEGPAACAWHRSGPPPGCILSWDMAECGYCSFYKPAEGEDSKGN
jgi:hypothetical protein